MAVIGDKENTVASAASSSQDPTTQDLIHGAVASIAIRAILEITALPVSAALSLSLTSKHGRNIEASNAMNSPNKATSQEY